MGVPFFIVTLKSSYPENFILLCRATGYKKAHRFQCAVVFCETGITSQSVMQILCKAEDPGAASLSI